MRARLAAVAIVAALVAQVAPAAQAHATAAGAYFRGPSGNVVCGVLTGSGLPSELDCGTRGSLTPPPPRPSTAACHHLDFATNRLRLESTGGALGVCSGDVGVLAELQTAPPLAYGATWHRRPFTCTSSRAWITCTNTAGHGFEISRSTWRRT